MVHKNILYLDFQQIMILKAYKKADSKDQTFAKKIHTNIQECRKQGWGRGCTTQRFDPRNLEINCKIKSAKKITHFLLPQRVFIKF